MQYWNMEQWTQKFAHNQFETIKQVYYKIDIKFDFSYILPNSHKNGGKYFKLTPETVLSVCSMNFHYIA